MEKKQDKDVLIVRDEKTGEVSVVAGLNADGSPKRTAAKTENMKDFLQFDRNGDVLDNFFKNFFRQCKEPSRFGFYRIAAEQADKLLDVMKELLKDPAANEAMLSAHKIDTSAYEKQVAKQKNDNADTHAEKATIEQEGNEQEGEQESEKESKQESKQETKEETIMGQEESNGQEQKQEAEAQAKSGYSPIDESKINWRELEAKWGINRDELEQSGDLKTMLNYGKSDLVRVKPTFGGETFEMEARLSFRQKEDGTIGITPHFIRKRQQLNEYKGHKFTSSEKYNLRTTGNLGAVVNLVDAGTGKVTPSIISIDRKTNEITDMAAEKVRIPNKIGKTEITRDEQAALRAGLPVRDKLIERNDGRKFIATLQVNVEQRGVEFVPGTSKAQKEGQGNANKQSNGQSERQDGNKNRQNTWVNEDGTIRPISKWKNVALTEQQTADFVAGKTVKLAGVENDKGQKSTIYVKFNREKNRPYRYSENPDKTQDVAKDNTQERQQQQQQQQKNKGMKV
ncbi:MAG: DUF3945 domain-containing protein [Prevotella sp.]|nr:DUF3945 domain-containing protein [Prevotella sp.]